MNFNSTLKHTRKQVASKQREKSPNDYECIGQKDIFEWFINYLISRVLDAPLERNTTFIQITINKKYFFNWYV